MSIRNAALSIVGPSLELFFKGQLTGRRSLRDVVVNMAVHGKKLYHLGFSGMSRATLARTNEKQPASMYEDLFNTMLKRYRHRTPGNRFKLRTLYLLDSTTIDLCLEVFPCPAPGTVLELCTPAFREHFASAPLIISKGQDNYEILSKNPAPIFFLLKAKCPVVAEHLETELGELLLVRSD